MSLTSLDERIDILRHEFARRLPERIAIARGAVDALRPDPRAEEPLRYAYRQFHSLVGSAGTYGYDEVSHLARLGEAILEAAFEGDRPLRGVDVDALRELLVALRNVGSPTKL